MSNIKHSNSNRLWLNSQGQTWPLQTCLPWTW